MLHKIFYLPLFLFAMYACTDNASEERTDGYSKKAETPEDSLFDEVMQGHDTAMAKMGKLGAYRKQVQQKLDSLGKANPKTKAAVENTLKELGEELKKAEDGMNKWMEDFDIDSAQDDIEQRIKYLTSEKIKVDEVKDKIFGTLKKADSLLTVKADSLMKK